MSQTNLQLKNELRKRLRHARLRFAARAPLLFVPLVVLACVIGCTEIEACIACGIACSLVAFGLYKGAPYEKAALTGVALGTIPLVVAALAMPFMASGNEALCQALCTWGSAIAAFVFVAFWGRGIAPAGLLFGSVIVICIAPIGCAAMTMGGALGFAGGVALALPIPLYALRRAI